MWVLIQLPESHASVYPSMWLTSSKKKGGKKETQFPLCALTRTYHSTSTVVILFFFVVVFFSVCARLNAFGSLSHHLTLTSHIHYAAALAQPALFPSVVLNYSVFLGQALVSSHCNDFLIICLYVMNEMEMYHRGQTGAGAVPGCHTALRVAGSRQG